MYYYIITSVIFWCNFKLFQEHIRDVGWRKSQWVLRQNSFVVWQKNHIITYCQLTNIHWSLYSNHDFLELCCKEERPTTWHMCGHSPDLVSHVILQVVNLTEASGPSFTQSWVSCNLEYDTQSYKYSITVQDDIMNYCLLHQVATATLSLLRRGKHG